MTSTRVAYHNLVGKSSPVQVAALACELDNVGVVAIDSMLPALIRNGLDDNSNSDLAAFYDVIARPLTAGGAPVVTVDHLTKDAANRTRGARGAGAKLQLVDVSYTVKLTKSFSKTREGDFKITCAKDRFGTFGIGETVADVTVTPYLDDSVTIHVGTPATVDPEKPFRPTRIMENISRALEESGPLNTNTLRTAARGDDKVKPLARTLLVNEGYIAEEHVGRESIYSSRSPTE